MRTNINKTFCSQFLLFLPAPEFLENTDSITIPCSSGFHAQKGEKNKNYISISLGSSYLLGYKLLLLCGWFRVSEKKNWGGSRLPWKQTLRFKGNRPIKLIDGIRPEKWGLNRGGTQHLEMGFPETERRDGGRGWHTHLYSLWRHQGSLRHCHAELCQSVCGHLWRRGDGSCWHSLLPLNASPRTGAENQALPLPWIV